MPPRILIFVALFLAPLAVARAHPIDDSALHQKLEAQQRRLEQQDRRIENQQRELDEVKRWIAAMQQGAPVMAETPSVADANAVASSKPVMTETSGVADANAVASSKPVMAETQGVADANAVASRKPVIAETPGVADANAVASSKPVMAAAAMDLPASTPLQVADVSLDTVDADPVPGTVPIGDSPVVRYSVHSFTPRPSEMFQVSLGGNLNRSVNVAADGNQTKPYFVDSSNIPTYLYIKTAARLHEDLTLRGHFEAGFQANPALRADQKDENAGFYVGARFFELIAETTKYGTLSFGHGFASSFLAFEIDQSGTQFGNLLSVGNTAGGLFFYDADRNAYSDTRVANAFIDGEELALINRVRYDSPRWAGLQLSGTVGQNDFRDVTLRFSGDAAGFVWSSGTSYQNRPNGPFGDWRWSIGGGVLHAPSGLNFTAGGALSQGEQGDNTNGYIARLGWRYPLFALGETKFAVGYANSWNVVEPGSLERSAGVFAFQNIDWAGLQLYTGYRWYDADVPSENLRNINVSVFGAAMQFDATWGF